MSNKTPFIASAVSVLTSLLKATIPPYADTESPLKAFLYATT